VKLAIALFVFLLVTYGFSLQEFGGFQKSFEKVAVLMLKPKVIVEYVCCGGAILHFGSILVGFYYY
jgi:hypothetical protein